MGTASSHHQEPMDRTSFHGSFKRSASLRFSKSKAGPRSSQRKMDKIRSSFRESFRRKKDPTPEISKQQQWQIDSSDVRTGTCCFHVKYLGCIEVFESRGMTVCEEALKVLRGSRRRPVKAILYISGDGLRVVEDDTKGLIVDQTIEKVSFCAPDRNHEKGFSYICRDGTTRRWLCHGFLALNESGERLSHAVGCAFALCLERKQIREKENVAAAAASTAVTAIVTNTTNGLSSSNTVTSSTSTTTNISTHTMSTVNALVAAAAIPANIVASYSKVNLTTKKENIPVKRTTPVTIHPVERPHATFSMLQRQGSFRGLSHLNQASPFKRQLSLKISDLPSNSTRIRNFGRPTESLTLATDTTSTGDNSISNAFIEKVDAVSLQTRTTIATTTSWIDSDINKVVPFSNDGFSATVDSSAVDNFPLYSPNNRSVDDIRSESIVSLKRSASFTPPATPPSSTFAYELPHPEQWLGKLSEITSNISELTANITELTSSTASIVAPVSSTSMTSSPLFPSTVNDNYLAAITTGGSSTPVIGSSILTIASSASSVPAGSNCNVSDSRKSHLLASHGRAHSLGSGENVYHSGTTTTNINNVLKSNDPFDAEWATSQVTQSSTIRSTNPFLTSVVSSDARLI